MPNALPPTRARGRWAGWVFATCLGGACLNPQPDEWPTHNEPGSNFSPDPNQTPAVTPAGEGAAGSDNSGLVDVGAGAGGGAGQAPGDAGVGGDGGSAQLPPGTGNEPDAGPGDAGGGLSNGTP